jgi:outer membrane lipoprotein carrier protein
MRIDAMRALLIMLLLVLSMRGHADGIEDLKNFVGGLKTFQANFTQTVTQGKRVEKETGVLTLKSPARFRWDYLKPHEHMVLGDGFHVWVFDKELDQVSRQLQRKAVKGSPAQVMTGDVAVDKTFNLSNLTSKDSLHWVKLVPKDKDSQYDYIKVAMKDKLMSEMHIVDKLSQTTRISFTQIKRNPKVAWDYFIFEVPKGVDLIDDKSEE